MTKKITYLEEGDLAILTREGVEIYDHLGNFVSRSIKYLDQSANFYDKSGFNHFMEKEIYEQPVALERAIKSYIYDENVGAKINLLKEVNFKEIPKIISNLDIIISMDSANRQIATNYDIPVVTIWGVTHPYAGFSPWNQNNQRNILSDRSLYPLIPTSVYGNVCPNGYENCMRTIPPEKIIEVVKKTMIQTSS